MPKLDGSFDAFALRYTTSLLTRSELAMMSSLTFGWREVYARPSIELCRSTALLALSVILTSVVERSSTFEIPVLVGSAVASCLHSVNQRLCSFNTASECVSKHTPSTYPILASTSAAILAYSASEPVCATSSNQSRQFLLTASRHALSMQAALINSKAACSR